jgi:cell division protein FtsB
MRKVGSINTEADAHLEESMAGFQQHLNRCLVRCEQLGLVDALQSFEARGVAQYGNVLARLAAVQQSEGEGKYLKALRDQVKETVVDLRDDVPEWKSLANATVLEVVGRCVELEEGL